MKLYDLIMQDLERAKGDSYWRVCKARLMRELKERFGGSLAVVRGPHGEERFQASEDSARRLGLVRQCLQVFMPWDTPCPLPGASPAPGKTEAFTFRGSSPDEEHQIEVARMRAIIHPDCHEWLVAGVGLESPARRLEIPKFFHTSGRDPEDGPLGDHEEAAEPTEDELAWMRRELDDLSARRKRPPTFRLRVLVDGVERAGLTLDRKSEATFEVEEGSKFIEVRTAREDGDVALAVHALSYDDAPPADPSLFSTELEGGRKISFTISPLRQLHEQSGVPVLGFSAVVSYEKARPAPVMARAWRRLEAYLTRVWRPRRLAGARAWRYSSAAVLGAVGISVLAWLLMVRGRTSQQTCVARLEELVAPPLPSSPPPVATVSPHMQDPRMTPSLPPASGPTRKTPEGVLRAEAGRPSASLLEVKKICVEATGGRQVDPAIIDHLSRGLQASRRWTIVARDEADALLSVAGGADGREFSVLLVNQEGKILWPRAGGDRGRKYGVAAEEAAKVVTDLLADVRELERRRRDR